MRDKLAGGGHEDCNHKCNSIKSWHDRGEKTHAMGQIDLDPRKKPARKKLLNELCPAYQ